MFGLLGPNGAGKTTLIKILLGIVRPSSGQANIFGLPHHRQSMRQMIGYLPEHFQVARHHTGVSALYFLGRLSRMSEAAIRKRIPEVIELVGLRGREKELVRTYSKGMKQRLGLAQALLHNPKLIFLDEPTDGLDPLGRHHVRLCIEALKAEGKTIFLNSHILQEVELICDQFAIMSKGCLKASGTLHELLSHATVGITNTHVVVEATKEKVESLIQQVQDTLPIRHEADDPSGRTVLNPNMLGNQENLQELNAANVDEAAEQLSKPLRHWRLVLDSVRQADIDCLVDKIRSHALSIIELAVHRPKLEQIFMQLVQSDEPVQSPGPK